METPINGVNEINMTKTDMEGSGDALAGGIPDMNYSLDTEKYNITKVMPDVILAEIQNPANTSLDGWVENEAGILQKAESLNDGIWKVAKVLKVGTDVKTVVVGDLVVVAGAGSGLKAIGFDGAEFALTREENVVFVVEEK